MVTYPFKNKSIPLYEIFIGGQLSPLTVHISTGYTQSGVYTCTMQHRVSNTGEDSQCLVQARIREKWQLQPKIQFNVQFFFLLILVSLRDPKFEWINKKKLVYFAYRLCGTCILNFMRYFLQNVNLFGRSLFGRSLYRLAE